ncbi:MULTISPECIES: flagellar biosynthetic protein FliQ [Ramlibacter]|uniref:Flagellar biosynthetic protein FliQ n=1 Tax=Ramlibacter aquaticus TaxID=2780094 RepID=A0ABR9SFC7_9BURK|nr:MULTISPECIES: flagellar biosynthetic protein FliQ [Ramlibacter]MBE7940919.1 flagellar biosynthetic protein FliQ [Ramlibacter aquaticus]
MQSDFALNLIADLFWTGFVVSMPLLASTMLVGLCISLLQAITLWRLCACAPHSDRSNRPDSAATAAY